MHLILTHEQVDFDALGALVAARLITPSARCALPHKMNRNVRKFVNLYRHELDLPDLADLPGEPIQAVTLVDTQSLVTLKNLRQDAEILVIDHHTQKPDFPASWKLVLEKVGATTTILVQQIQGHNIPVTPLQATLMLLGIHEDTGSLTYTSTTVKDIAAAAFLVEKSADLRMLNEYLNPPLSSGQMTLADELLRNAVLSTIAGKKILISQAVSMDLDEEVSSIAHKIRDLLDPDALFLFVRGKEGLRLVARSSTDDVDVSRVAHLFGGGGHMRASAALIHADDPLLQDENPAETAISKLIEFLRKEVKPSLTVSKIMSKKPLLLTKETSIDDALRLMQRYGYEGYPVVDGSTVVGLLTRHAVDKAAGHKLELSAGSLMEAGNYTLSPDQTLDEVQELMANTGWGQIPVVDAVSGSIIGIVTRTDLLKNLHRLEPKKNSNGNYAAKIEKALSPGRMALLNKVIETANEHDLPVYTVGGFVRDLLLERPSRDFDIVIEGDAIRIAEELARKFGGRVVSHRRFGTAKWQIKDIHADLTRKLKVAAVDSEPLPEFLDLISARTEFYEHPTAMPTIENSSIKLDLHRRDFTINTLAIRLDRKHYGELIDNWGGLEDLRNKKIRVLHSLSFVDDPTRMLRAVRFEQRFGFAIEDRTLQLMEEARPMLRRVSGDRLRHEFDLAFREANPAAVLARMSALDLLAAIHPQLGWDASLAQPMNTIRTSQPAVDWELPRQVGNVPLELALHWLVWLGSLQASTAKEVSRRFKFPAPLAAALTSTAEARTTLNTLTEHKPSLVSSLLDGYPTASLYAAWLLEPNPQIRELLVSYTKNWKKVRLVTTGNDLRNAGILPGPDYKRILSTLRAAYLDGTISSPEEESALLQYLIQQD